MHFEVVTLFPELVGLVGRFGVVGRALERGCCGWGRRTRASSRRIRTGPWMTGPTAAARAW
jgi:hypothetical protein